MSVLSHLVPEYYVVVLTWWRWNIGYTFPWIRRLKWAPPALHRALRPASIFKPSRNPSLKPSVYQRSASEVSPCERRVSRGSLWCCHGDDSISRGLDQTGLPGELKRLLLIRQTDRQADNLSHLFWCVWAVAAAVAADCRSSLLMYPLCNGSCVCYYCVSYINRTGEWAAEPVCPHVVDTSSGERRCFDHNRSLSKVISYFITTYHPVPSNTYCWPVIKLYSKKTNKKSRIY